MKDVNFPQARIFSFATVQTKNSLSHNPEDYSLHEGEPRNKFKKEEKSLNLGKRKRKRELRTALVAVSNTPGCYEAKKKKKIPGSSAF